MPIVTVQSLLSQNFKNEIKLAQLLDHLGETIFVKTYRDVKKNTKNCQQQLEMKLSEKLVKNILNN